ncbi:nitroreductase/quinone reductase family protein [Amycolatopsis sacchari]|uniref:nitroreductase/quinone reductase family protein n=1 Tax=Amycolatopsis sacchari TaxID=115433 RepID=UPI003D72726C
MPEDVREFNRAVVAEFRATGGAMGEGRFPRPLVLLTTTGAKSGREHTVPLGDLSDDPARVVVGAMGRRGPKNPAWLENLLANPAVVVERRGADGRLERIETTAVIAEGDERARIVAGLRELRPQVDEFEAQTGRLLPIVLLDCARDENRS